ncbi:MAG: L,D-transpeptidase family protein [Chitinophagaceae bacterium]|nr:L,D-transpeptidase family protein [Chitinophagaceae bacterium]
MKCLNGILFGSVLSLTVLFACKEKKPDEKDIVAKPEQLEDRVRRNLQEFLHYAEGHNNRIDDSLPLNTIGMLRSTYEENGYAALWSGNGAWLPEGSAVYRFIKESRNYGLFPKDYHFTYLSGIYDRLLTDSLSQKDAALWSRADLALTDATLRICHDLKRGRLPYDSLTLRVDTALNEKFYLQALSRVRSAKGADSVFQELEPAHSDYRALRSAIKGFLDTADFSPFTYLPYPIKDTVAFYALLQKRLLELNVSDSAFRAGDTTGLAKTLAAYQRSRNIKPSGRVNETTVKNLNDTDTEKFKRIALTLDKFKLLPDSMPAVYVWVNLPAYQLKVIEADTIALQSKVIVGAPKTRTPELNSEISNFITYPQWTVPYSIVFKEMLPQIQKNINYLRKQNLMVVDKYDSVIDPATIDWSSLSQKKFPYQIRQREGDDNSLGVLKFNFRNPYSVYLHDTNARWLFGRPFRALSHGCVRVQSWKSLAHFLVRNDTIKYPADTLSQWIARQEKHVVSGFKKTPILIRYYTCEGKSEKLIFHEDIYGEDRMLTEKYF